MNSSVDTLFPGLRHVPMTGVIYVTTQAAKLGFNAENSEWSNLGQGAPEVGKFDNEESFPSFTTSATIDEYAPVAGMLQLREQIATLYNQLYRSGKKSQYTPENVAISGGGRLALTRIAAVLGNIHVGHLIPDYTAYEELLTTFKSFTPIPLQCSKDHGYKLDIQSLTKSIDQLGLGAILLSNPSNPTGQLLSGDELKSWVDVGRSKECLMIFDEFYSHYIYDKEIDGSVSSAEFIDDVNTDPIVIVDGLTKNWRKPGWRISWTLGPKDVISSVASAGSFMDGGAPHPLQNAAISLLDVEKTIYETRALQNVFLEKRDYTLSRLDALGIHVPCPPQGAFYCWANISNLPDAINTGMKFFNEGLKEKVITVPGEFFDINPGRRRSSGAFSDHIRISFGPDMNALQRGLDAIERMIKKHS